MALRRLELRAVAQLHPDRTAYAFALIADAPVEIWRLQVELHHHCMITAAVGGELAAERAALLLALFAGFQVMRQMIGLSALAEADPDAQRK